jgi:hypothetical protein
VDDADVHVASGTEGVQTPTLSGIPASRIGFLVLPVLASVCAPLVIAANLPGELLRFRDFARPIGVTLAVCGVAWALCYAVRRSPEKAALGAAWTVVAYSSVGAIDRMLSRAMAYHVVGGSIGVVGLCAVAFLAGLIALLGTRRSLGGLVRYLAVLFTLLLVWNAGKVAWKRASDGGPPSPPVAAEITAPLAPPPPARDIYLIVLDKYTSSAALGSNFGFDNRGFDDALRARGFIVPPAARPNYIHTFLTLGAMLNLRYLDELTAKFGNDYRWELAYPLVENNRLISFLHTRGYRVVNFPNEFWGTRENRYADLQLPHPRDVHPELIDAWEPATAGPVLWTLACRLAGCDADAPPTLPGTPELMDWRFKALAALPQQSRQPTFVLAHLLVPHEPYIYGPVCQHLTPFWPLRDAAHAERVRRAYLDQIRCTNTKVLAAVDAILADSRVPPIVLIQSDHGHGRLGRVLPPLAQVPATAVYERTSVFAAYHLPGVSADSISPRITPVNIMRFVLRHYFQAALPPLPDATFWSGTSTPYQFEPVP